MKNQVERKIEQQIFQKHMTSISKLYIFYMKELKKRQITLVEDSRKFCIQEGLEGRMEKRKLNKHNFKIPEIYLY